MLKKGNLKLTSETPIGCRIGSILEECQKADGRLDVKKFQREIGTIVDIDGLEALGVWKLLFT